MLAANLGWVDWDLALSLLQLWPLILVLIGIRLLLGDRRPTLAIGLMVLVLVAGVGIAAATYSSGGRFGWKPVKTTPIEGPMIQGLTRAHATIQLGATTIDIVGRDTGTAVQVLAPNLPWILDLQTGAVDPTFDLTNVTLQAMTLKAGASSVDITVGPRVAPGAMLALDGGVGSFTLRLPRQLDITLTSSTGISSVDVDRGFSESSNNVFVPNGDGDALKVTDGPGARARDRPARPVSAAALPPGSSSPCTDRIGPCRPV